VPKEGRSAGSPVASRPRKKKTNKIYLIASVAIAVLVIAGFAVGGLGRGGGGGEIAKGSNGEYKDGVGLRQEPMPTGPDGLNLHVENGQTVEYSTTPPTSGDHWAELANCGFYREELPDELIVHNLEHGNIVVSYNLTDQEEIDELRRVISNIGLANLWGIVRPYDKLQEGRVALATWGVLDTMDGVDPGRIEAFFEYAGNLGPERAPC
jgi:hypothetical protein